MIAGVERHAVVIECHRNEIRTDLEQQLDAKLAALRRGVANDVADYLLEHQLNVVAGAGFEPVPIKRTA